MANGDDDETIEPGNGRILGSGSNNLQRSIDSLNNSVQRLLTANSGGMGGMGRGGPPLAPVPPGGLPEPRRGSDIVPRGDRFPAAVSWDSNDSSGYSYAWGAPVRNTTRAPQPTMTAANRQAVAGGGGGGGNFRTNINTARRWVRRIQNFGNRQLQMALPMDNYAQWAAISAGSPLGPDGTNGRTVNSVRKFVFGSQGNNQIMWAQNAQDASAAAFIASRNSGFSPIVAGSNSQINPAFSNYLGGIKDLAITNPMMNASDAANVLGTLSSTRGLYSAMMFGYKPVLGAGGQVDRNALSGFADSVLRSAYRGKASVAPNSLAASLGQNGVLNANIQAYVNAAGGSQKTVQALEDYITARNTALQHGTSSTQFDQLLSDYEKGGAAGDAAGAKLKKLGISNSILQSQKDVSAAKAENTSDLLDSFGPAVKKANEALADFYNTLDHINNLPILKQLIGYTAGFGSVFGGAASTLLGGIGVMGASRLLGGRGGAGVPGGVAGPRGGIGGGPAPTVIGGSGALRAGAVGAAATFGVSEFLSGWNSGPTTNESVKSRLLHSISPVTGVQNAGSWARRLWNKGQGNSGESWLGVLNPLGNAKPKAHGPTESIKDWDPLGSLKRTTGNDGIGGGLLAPPGGGGSTSASSSADTGQVITGKSASGAIAAALAQIGKPYQWGGTGPDSWDCSGLTQHAYATIGVRLPRTSEQQMGVGQAVDRKDVRPGDLMFPYSGHVVMYIGSGKIVEAPRTGENVRVASVNEYGRYAAIRRIVGAVGNLSGIGSSPAPAQKPMAGNSGGDSGSAIISGNYGSVEEIDAISSALSSAAAAVSSAPQGESASSANSGVSATSSASSTGPWKKDGASVNRAKALGKQLAQQLYGWTGQEWSALDHLFTGESGWRWWAENPSSHAYGIVQSLPGSKMASVGKDWRTNPATQLKWGMKYIHDRYGDPMNAYATWSARSPHWYNTGAWEIPQDGPAVVHKGEMIIEKPKADTIRNALMRDLVNVKDAATGTSTKNGGGGISLVFGNNSVVFQVQGAMTDAQAKAAGQVFAQTLANDERLKSLGKGL